VAKDQVLKLNEDEIAELRELASNKGKTIANFLDRIPDRVIEKCNHEQEITKLKLDFALDLELKNLEIKSKDLGYSTLT
jgi:hypothetical protein